MVTVTTVCGVARRHLYVGVRYQSSRLSKLKLITVRVPSEAKEIQQFILPLFE